MTKLFDAKSTPDYCPQCHAELVLRRGVYGLFKGCSNYPECDYKSPMKAASGHIVKILPEKNCPDCGESLALRQGKFGMFIACSHYPDCHYSEQAEKSEDEGSVTCPSCQKGPLRQRRARTGKIFYGCDRYPDCRFILNATPVAGLCPECQFPLLMKKKTVSGDIIVCANKQCGKKISND